MSNIRCFECGKVYVTTRSNPDSWGCPNCEKPRKSRQTFTVDPYAVRTQFAPATRPAYPQEQK
jgi:predicted  nucleic acid-binding Zn-ribbon protein